MCQDKAYFKILIAMYTMSDIFLLTINRCESSRTFITYVNNFCDYWESRDNDSNHHYIIKYIHNYIIIKFHEYVLK